jgi:hypothetical protein
MSVFRRSVVGCGREGGFVRRFVGLVLVAFTVGALVVAVGGGRTARAAAVTVTVAKLSDAVFGFGTDCTQPASQHATFRLTRTDTSGSLAVSISTGGSAVAGQDYAAPNPTVTFPDGVASVDVALDGAPSTDFLLPARTTTVLFTVDPGSGYVVGDPSSTSATITYLTPTCAPATFPSIPVNFLQTVPSNQLPQPLVVDPLPPGTTFIYFTTVFYPPGVPQSWFPPRGLSWYYQGPVPNQFTWYWVGGAPNAPVDMAPGAYSFDVRACAYYRQIALYYASTDESLSSSCTTIKFTLNVEAAGLRLPTFTG